MPQNTPLYIVTSQHPRVGKTLIARLLIESFRFSDRPVIGYDLDPREPTFASLFPKEVVAIDITETPGQMALFDQLVTDSWRTTVIDLAHGKSDQFFAVMSEIGFEREARRRLMKPVVLFIADSAPATAKRYAELRQLLPDTAFVPVHNEAASFMLIEQDFPPSRRDLGKLHIPRLSPVVRGVIDRPGFSFSAYLGKRPGGPTEVHTWIDTIFSEFRELELRLLIGELESSLRGYARQSAYQAR